jgi:hypothetical protein
MGYGFSDHLYTPLGTTSNYSSTANLHILQITAANTKSSPTCIVFNSRSLATALTVEILQLPTLMSFLSGEYPATELSQTRSAGLGSSLYSPKEDPKENTAFNISSIVMGGCLAMARILLMCLQAVTKQHMFRLTIVA